MNFTLLNLAKFLVFFVRKILFYLGSNQTTNPNIYHMRIAQKWSLWNIRIENRCCLDSLVQHHIRGVCRAGQKEYFIHSYLTLLVLSNRFLMFNCLIKHKLSFQLWVYIIVMQKLMFFFGFLKLNFFCTLQPN